MAEFSQRWEWPEFIIGLGAGISIGMIILCGILGWNPVNGANVKDLGNAICTEQQNSTFDYYEDGVLYCKENKAVPYDGIFISSDEHRKGE